MRINSNARHIFLTGGTVAGRREGTLPVSDRWCFANAVRRVNFKLL